MDSSYRRCNSYSNDSIPNKTITTEATSYEPVGSTDSPKINKKYVGPIKHLIYESKEHKIIITEKGDYLWYNNKVYKKDATPQFADKKKYEVESTGLYWLRLPNEGYRDKGYTVALEYNNRLFYDRILVCDKYDVVNTYFRYPLKE